MPWLVPIGSEFYTVPKAAEYLCRVIMFCTICMWHTGISAVRSKLNRHDEFLADILFLCAGLRSVILMDYGGTMPLLQENLCSLLHHAQQEASILNPLRVMVIKDMLYLIHVKGLAEHVSPNARSRHQPAFVDLEKSSACQHRREWNCAGAFIHPRWVFRTSLVLDLSAILENTQIALPSLNGWLLGYPVTYLFRNESAEAATQNLSKHSLHIYRIYVVRSPHSDAKPSEEELLSFSVPCEMSVRRDEEPWAKSFLACMNEKLERCNHVWASMRLEIDVFRSQSGVIVL
ncbi:uncharacterized protein LOC100824223 isoform X8 [Brachypodium distachyon]|uniref:uncharacterized protein LOC100824223 isoform X8 n=1 Tax=Brachypodium distachyon TaxID=15368 RepID=UPI00071DC0C0|nr:uncharacterized protein LOC100824223 isoform X8 [Brachypodium distachyon]|eukprot:XP_014758499.1 uncharacterized protein LOC100824223 isoform X8 [Brachypodium distachyon]